MRWPTETLARIAATDDLHVAPFRDDGVTYGTLTWIWSVVVDDALFVRAYYGVASRWHQAAMRQKAGRISAAGQTFEVAFERLAPDDALQARIDDAYRAKYASSSYLGSMISDRARAATVRVVLRAE
ncbi:MAG: DUF2255 family protein [Sandaracinus sp.]|nr:DUF2255 family protein [Myxococcales bacterium]MCB9613826.1 DUF2255 family protein [Sandaracinus sp.]